MTEKKKVRVKVKRRKLNISKILIFVLGIYLLYYGISSFINVRVKNIYITQSYNYILNDYDIMDATGMLNYPAFLKINVKNVKNKLLKNDYIESVSVKKKFFGKLLIDIKYYIPLCIYNNKVLLSSGKYVSNDYQLYYIPKMLSYLDSEMLMKFVKAFKKVDSDILDKISEIEYAKIDVDINRFLLYMNDGNYVYITLDRIDVLNKYDDIYPKLEGKKGILNLDSGNSFEIRESN